MTYILLWSICGVSAFYLLKNYVESNLRSLPSPPENIAQAMRNAAKRDDSVDPMDDCPDHIANSLFWTILLVYNLLCWPFCLCTLIYWTVIPQDFSIYKNEML